MQAHKLLLLIPVASLLTACHFFQPIEKEQTATFTLDKIAHTQNSKRTTKNIVIGHTVASPGYESAKMIYTDKPYHLKAFIKNKWVAPPASMLTTLINQSLAHTNYYRAVVSSPFSGEADLRLDTSLVKLQQEFLGPTSQIRMVVDARLVDNGTQKIIATKRFESHVTAAENDPYRGVLAANQATQEILQQLVNFCLHNSI